MVRNFDKLVYEWFFLESIEWLSLDSFRNNSYFAQFQALHYFFLNKKLLPFLLSFLIIISYAKD
jgi:hypothetical protein